MARKPSQPVSILFALPWTLTMFPGPVFKLELVRTARRNRFFLMRVVYVLIVLFILWQNYASNASWLDRRNAGGLTISEMASFGLGMFASFAGVQFLAVLGLVPSLVAGTIAEEKQRKTLHDLLVTPLGSSAIVLGKLTARLLHVGVYLALGLPVTIFLSLFGGVDPLIVLLVYAGTLSTAFFVAALSICFSAIARTVREAVSGAYGFEAVWFLVPSLISALMPTLWPRVYAWVRPVNEWVKDSSPFELLLSLRRGPSVLLSNLSWMIGLQLVYGSLFVLLAVLWLRPTFRKQESRPARMTWLSKRGLRMLPRPACGDDPMLWKERFVSRTRGAVKVVGLLIGLSILAILSYETYQMAQPAFAQGDDGAIMELNLYIRTLGTGAYLLLALGVASAAATSVATEREEGTWSSLLATPLSGVEIVRAKMFGAVWRYRVIVYLVVLLWLIGFLARAVHPLGFVLEVIELVVFTGFAAALGAYHSLKAKTTSHAQGVTIGQLSVLNSGMFCLGDVFVRNTFLTALSTPLVFWMSLVSSLDIESFTRDPARVNYLASYGVSYRLSSMALYGALGIAGYAVAAVCLTRAALSGFDEAADRPRRSRYAALSLVEMKKQLAQKHPVLEQTS